MLFTTLYNYYKNQDPLKITLLFCFNIKAQLPREVRVRVPALLVLTTVSLSPSDVTADASRDTTSRDVAFCPIIETSDLLKLLTSLTVSVAVTLVT